MPQTTALITGGSGYFGSLLRDNLRARDQTVRVFDLSDAEDRTPEVSFARGDVRDKAAVREACAGCEVVYHCVAQVPLAKDQHLFESVNIQGTDHLLSAAKAAKVRKVIWGEGGRLTAGRLIERLNPLIRGWALYHRHGASKRPSLTCRTRSRFPPWAKRSRMCLV